MNAVEHARQRWHEAVWALSIFARKGTATQQDWLLLDAYSIALDLVTAEWYRGRAASLHARQNGDMP